jgi:ABC-type polysaccharide/polyol phosphate export permease
VNYQLDRSQAIALVVDLGVAAACWTLVCWMGAPLIFDDRAAMTRLLIVNVAAQLAALAIAGAYQSRPVSQKLGRLLLGAVGGALLAGALLRVAAPRLDLGRDLIGLDLALFLPAIIGWRAARVIWASRRAPAEPIDARFIDRTTEPSSLLQTFRSLVAYRELLRQLVMRDLKLKYRGSVLGFLWSLGNPLAMVIVYTFAFRYILQMDDPGYVFKVLIGIISWTLFASAATMSTGSIIESTGLVRAVQFPRAILPVATVFFNLAQFLLTAFVFVPVMLLGLGVPPSWPMLLFPVVLLLQVAFIVGVALMLSVFTTKFRDIKHLVEVILPLLFWTTPIFYPLSVVPESNQGMRMAIQLSPMSPFVISYQRILYDGQVPDVFVTITAVVYGLSMLAIGGMIFLSAEDELVEQL